MKTKILIILICFCLLSLSVSAQTKEAVKFVEFGNHSCEEWLARMDALLTEMSKEPDSKAHVLIYVGRFPVYGLDKNGKHAIKKYTLPQVGEVKSRIRTMIRRFAFRQFPRERIVFVDAGFREEYTVEFWIVAPGAEAPKPTPTLKKIKYRKGKPQDFCDGDVI